MKPKTVDEYIRMAAPKARPHLRTLRQIIKKEVPEVKEKIGYSMPYYNYLGMFTGFAAFPNHIGLYTLNMHIKGDLKKRADKYVTSKGTMQFSYDKALPANLIRKLVREKGRRMEKKKKNYEK
ncbi:MAG TPA: DUF1801 domain-containing protein [Candidatus Paceibacterota bacterium]|nr:DUF1801 domain-containing protein [Candidatus Paceibacterota bacterium]